MNPKNMPQFGQAPILGQQKQKMAAQIQMAIGKLSVEIYAQLATGHIATRDEHQNVDQQRLRQLAKDAQAAARCYFEGIGVIHRELPEPLQEKEDEL